MTRFNIVLALVLLVGGSTFSFSQSAIAQSTYMPQTSPVSPWMGLWQRNTGPLDNYHSYVLPQMQLNAALQSQNAALGRQAAGLQYLGEAVTNQQTGQLGTSGMSPTGQNATFMNYSHYFGLNRQMPGSGSSITPRTFGNTSLNNAGNTSGAMPSVSSLRR